MIVETLERVKTQLQTHENMNLRGFINAFAEDGLLILLILFALPISLPIFKPPGLSTIIGTPLILVAIQVALGRHTPWIPARYENLIIPADKLVKVIDTCIPAFRWVQRLFKPRFTTIPETALLRFIGIIALLFCVPILTPFPFSNAMPALAIVLMACAYLMRDALGVLLAAVFGFAWILLLVLAGREVLDLILGWFFGGA